tara:strand:- start:97 stop:408 length:312 start_codon:yes stop_codon:yes gene_type:complete
MDDIGKLLVGFAFNIEQRKGKYASMSRLINNLEMAREQGEQAKTKDSMSDKLAAFLDGATKKSKAQDELLLKMSKSQDSLLEQISASQKAISDITSRLDKAKL